MNRLSLSLLALLSRLNPCTHTARIALIIVCMSIAAGCDDDGESQNTPEPSPLEQAVEAIGGTDALAGLSMLRIEAAGTRWIDYEGMEPSEIHDAGTYTNTYLLDLAADALRVDVTRMPLFEAFQFFPPETYSVVVNGDVGGLTAQAGFFPAGAMPSQNVGALIQQQRLFNPYLLLRTALADPTIAGDGGEADHDGRPHRILTIMDGGAEVRLFVDAETGLISKLETLENSPLFRDVPVEVRFADWQAQGPLSFPGTVALYAVEGLVQQETRSTVTLDPTDVAADASVPITHVIQSHHQ